MDIFACNNIVLNAKIKTKEEAISQVGWLLVENGYVKPEYVNCMLEREKVVSTYMGNNVAVPHGIGGSEQFIIHSGVALLRVPEGVKFTEDDNAYIIIGIAGKGGQHIDILSNIAIVCSDEENVKRVLSAESSGDIIDILNGGE